MQLSRPWSNVSGISSTYSHADTNAKTSRVCQTNRLKVLSRAMAEKTKLDASYQHPSDDESIPSDGESRRRNSAIVRALRTSKPAHSGPFQVNPMSRPSRLNMSGNSRVGSHSASIAQLIKETVWKLDAYDNQPKQMREKYYAYKEWSLRNEGTHPQVGDVGGKAAVGPSASHGSTTGSTDYDASRDPRLQR